MHITQRIRLKDHDRVLVVNYIIVVPLMQRRRYADQSIAIEKKRSIFFRHGP